MINKNTFMLGIAVISLAWGASVNFSSPKGKGKKKGEEEVKIADKIDSLNYSIGVNIGTSLRNDSFPLRGKALLAGIEDMVNGKTPKITEDNCKGIVQNYFSSMQDKRMKEQKEKQAREGMENQKKADEFLQAHKNEAGVMSTNSGIQYKIIKSGTGKTPTLQNSVTCHYEGTLLNGTKFDSSFDRGEPATFPLNGVIQGWQETLQLMKEGDVWEVWIPPHLAYGPNGAGGMIGPNECLKFKIELIKVQ